MKYSLLFLPFFLLLMNCGGGETETIEKRIRAVRSSAITLSDGTSNRTFSGVVEAAGATPLSFRVGGTLGAIKVQLGDRVKTGQLIATLDPADMMVQSSQASAQREASLAQLNSAKTQLIAAQTAYERTSKLYENNSVSLSDFEQARSQFKSAQSQVAAAQAQLDANGAQVRAAGNQVNYTRLSAPFAGIITALEVEQNEFIGSGKAVVTLSTEEKPEVKVKLPEGIIGMIQQGMKVKLSLPAIPQQSFNGTVSEVAYAAGGAPSYPVTIKIEDESDAVRPGMAASVTFTFTTSGKAQEEKLLAPVESIAEGTEGKYVFLLVANDSTSTYLVRRHPVEIGALESNGFIVKSGLKQGDLVATAGLNQLLDGMEVRLITK